eukprot:gene8183-11070_t
MLSDARSLWLTASSALASLNENITSALENLDVAVDDESHSALTENEDSLMSNAALKAELDTYKRLLDDAQMNHFELSKHSRILMAEKDAEITFLRKKNGDITSSPSNKIDMSEPTMMIEKLISEKMALQISLDEIQEMLRDALHERNESKVLRKNLEDLTQRFDRLKSEMVELKSEGDKKEKQKVETIDNLVVEYSKLAAESELLQNQHNKRIAEVILENEVLVTKMHALEHSITEIADRSVGKVIIENQESTNSSGVTTGFSSSDSSAVIASLTQELKELKAKQVNLMYDLKEREEELAKFKTSSPRSSSTPLKFSTPSKESTSSLNESNNDLISTENQKLQTQISNLEKDVSRLLSEKKEAEEAGKRLSEQTKKLQKELENLNSLQSSSDPILESLKVEKKQLEEMIINLTKQHKTNIEQLTIEHNSEKTEAEETSKHLSEQTKKLQKELENLNSLQSSSDPILENLKNEKKQLEEMITNLTEQHKTNIEQLTIEHNSTISNINNEKDEKYKHLMDELQVNHTKEIENMIQNLSNQKQSYESSINELNESLLSHQKSYEIVTNEMKLLKENENKIQLLCKEKSEKIEKLNYDLESLRVANVTGSESMKEELVNNYNKQINDLKSKLLEEITKFNNEINAKNEEIIQIKEINEKELKLKLSECIQSERLKADQMLQTELFSQKNKILDLENKENDLQNIILINKSNHENEIKNMKELLLEEYENNKKNEILLIINEQEEKSKKNLELLLQQTRKEYDELMNEKEKKILNEQHEIHTKNIQKLENNFHDIKNNALQELRNELQLLKEQELDLFRIKKEDEKQYELKKIMEKNEIDLKLLLENVKKTNDDILENNKKEYENKINIINEELKKIQAELSQLKVELDQLIAKKDLEKSDAIVEVKSESQVIIDKANAERDEHLANYTRERKLRKKIHNKLLEIQGNIRVICRVRPILEVERKSGEDVDVTEFPNDEELLIQRDSQTKTKYEFDRVFAPGSSQEDVFEAVQPLCVSVLDGYNVCIFAYGQTGSGKTFTMEGYGSDIGVSPRAISELFNQVKNLSEDWTYVLQLSMLEIYNETILDLQNANKEKLEIRQTPEGNQVTGLTEIQINSIEQVKELMTQGQANRAVGSHDMNEHSSRSHSIVTVTCRGKNKLDGSTTFGKLHLIDLAGSERISKTDATGDRLKEAQNINKSLSALGDVVNALGNKKATHIPYRNSKLTFLLQDSLGGNSKVLTFVNISPAVYNLSETVCSLNFASRCRSTELGQAKKQSNNPMESPSSLNSSNNSLGSTGKLSRDKRTSQSTTNLSNYGDDNVHSSPSLGTMSAMSMMKKK